MICCTNQSTSFYIIRTSVMKELKCWQHGINAFVFIVLTVPEGFNNKRNQYIKLNLTHILERKIHATKNFLNFKIKVCLASSNLTKSFPYWRYLSVRNGYVIILYTYGLVRIIVTCLCSFWLFSKYFHERIRINTA